MITAIAGLETGVITPTEKINDIGVYKKAHEPACWIWNSYGMSHGWLNVTEAITHSCNYFFYEVGYRLGDKSGSYSSKEGLKYLEKYTTQLGLNKQSGIELDESSPQVSDETSVRSAIG